MKRDTYGQEKRATGKTPELMSLKKWKTFFSNCILRSLIMSTVVIKDK